MIEILEYSLERLRKDGEFILYRGRHRRQTIAVSCCSMTLAQSHSIYSLKSRWNSDSFCALQLVLARHSCSYTHVV